MMKLSTSAFRCQQLTDCVDQKRRCVACAQLDAGALQHAPQHLLLAAAAAAPIHVSRFDTA